MPRKNINKNFKGEEGEGAATQSPLPQQQNQQQQQYQQRPIRPKVPLSAGQQQPTQQQQQQGEGGSASGSGGKKEGGKRNDACCVFVGNVAFTTTWQKLKDVMRKAGDVDLVELVVDSSHKPKGSALVSFKNEEDAKTAVQTLNGTMVDGREVLVRQYERGARPLVIYGNYTREQLNRVIPKDKQFDGPAAAGQQQQQQQQPQQQQQQRGNYHDNRPGHHDDRGFHQQQQGRQPYHGGQGATLPGGDRVSLRPQGQGQGGRQEWRVHDGGDFNKRNRDTFGDDAVAYRAAQGNGVPSEAATFGAGAGGGGAARHVGGDREHKKLFVSNLPFSCSWKLLKDTFSQVGKVLRADIIMDERGRSRGMGTVLFATNEEAVKAIEEFDGIEMEGRAMSVRLDRDFGANQ
jgi:RNA recognition motif-containing protein